MSGFSLRGMAERIARGRSFWSCFPPEVGDATRDDVVKLLEHANYHLSDYQLESGSGVVSMASSNLLARPR